MPANAKTINIHKQHQQPDLKGMYRSAMWHKPSRHTPTQALAVQTSLHCWKRCHGPKSFITSAVTGLPLPVSLPTFQCGHLARSRYSLHLFLDAAHLAPVHSGANLCRPDLFYAAVLCHSTATDIKLL